MGLDYLGLISYYLSSPLNLLCVLVPEHMALELFSLLMPLKLGFAGLFFAFFLKSIFKKNDFSICVFAGFYATCAFAMAYQWNVMWLDSFALLPLVMTGMVRLLKDRKFILYTVALFFCFFSNYYIGYIVCLFVFLVFFCFEICRFPGVKRFFQDLARIAVFSIIALVAQLIGTFAMWSQNGKTIRVLQLAAVSPLWLIHNVFVFSIGGIICEVFNLGSIIVSIIRFGIDGFEKDK